MTQMANLAGTAAENTPPTSRSLDRDSTDFNSIMRIIGDFCKGISGPADTVDADGSDTPAEIKGLTQ